MRELSRCAAGVKAADELRAKQILASTGSQLSMEEVASLAKACFASPDSPVARLVKEHSTVLRQRLFGNSVVVMAPVEMSNACASDCQFCGWRVSNHAMRRIRLPEDLIMMQVEYLVDLGFHYIELVSGDDFVAVRESMPRVTRQIRQLFESKGIEGKISFCSLALTEKQYRELREAGADSMIMWQETYDPNVFNTNVLAGPKAHGINDAWQLNQERDGCAFRIGSQERALRAGIEVSLGSMLGLNPDMLAEFLAVVEHARYLEKNYGATAEHPIIIGMPIWNPITTPETDKRPGEAIDFEQLFPVLAALFLLALPSEGFWIFPNCRVSMRTQIEAARVAGAFSSTEVKLGPGGYLPSVIRAARARGEDTSALEKRIAELLREESTSLEQLGLSLDSREQFVHNYHNHQAYCRLMREAGLEIVSGVRTKCPGQGETPALSRE